MVSNPWRARAQHRTSAMLTRIGWEPPQSWPAGLAGGRPLVFHTQLPAARFVAAADLPARDRAAPASVGADLVGLGQAAGAEHVFLAAAICSTVSDHGVLATMTAALAPRPLPFTDRDGRVRDGRRGRRRVKGMHGRVSVIERQDGDQPGSPLVVQYAVRRRPGTLTLTFVTQGSALAGNARRLFLNIVRGCRLEPGPDA